MTSTVQHETGWSYDPEKETWRGPGTRVTGPHEHELRDIRPGTLQSDLKVPAANVLAGTFGAGDYVFSDALRVTETFRAGDGAGSLVTLYTGGGGAVDIAGWLDFHRFVNADEAANYNVRLQNDADNRLSLVGTGNPEFVVGGGAVMRLYPGDTSYVEIKHLSSSRYQVLMRNDGNTYLDSGSGANTYVRANGTTRFQANASYASIYEGEVFGSLHMRDNWVRNYGAVGMYNQTYAGGVYMGDSTWLQSYAAKSFLVNSHSNVIRCGSADLCTWGSSSGHATVTYAGQNGWGYMTRSTGDMWIMCPGELRWRMNGADILYARNSGGWLDFRPHLVTLGGTTVVIAGSDQLGRSSSSGRYKVVLGDLSHALGEGINEPIEAHRNPVFFFKPLRYHWNELVANHEDINPLFPDGIAGFVAEDVMDVAPDAVVYDSPGVPANLDANAMLAYVVGGLQHVHSGGHRRHERLKALEPKVEELLARVKAIENLSVIKAQLGKGK